MTNLTFSVEDISRRADDMRKMDGSRISFRGDEVRKGKTGLRYKFMGVHGFTGSRDSRPSSRVRLGRTPRGVSSALQKFRPIRLESNAVVEWLRHTVQYYRSGEKQNTGRPTFAAKRDFYLSIVTLLVAALIS
jgi:hypothetical protein